MKAKRSNKKKPDKCESNSPIEGSVQICKLELSIRQVVLVSSISTRATRAPPVKARPARASRRRVRAPAAALRHPRPPPPPLPAISITGARTKMRYIFEHVTLPNAAYFTDGKRQLRARGDLRGFRNHY
ncbi:hypothetical protein EVAR_5519_1 [Eumeta japonica]|uniref:Uncharacterized protein n=1 Tax=Eumeta variegata TaxID=151549 RepID=A0A4C1TBJ3_EUMVA|nr:hypothetical protein EVAR_5519_1 [Eumeta japonica]